MLGDLACSEEEADASGLFAHLARPLELRPPEGIPRHFELANGLWIALAQQDAPHSHLTVTVEPAESPPSGIAEDGEDVLEDEILNLCAPHDVGRRTRARREQLLDEDRPERLHLFPLGSAR